MEVTYFKNTLYALENVFHSPAQKYKNMLGIVFKYFNIDRNARKCDNM